MNALIQKILQQECSNYSRHYGCFELKHIIGSPFHTCEINGKKTALYPIAQRGNVFWEYDDKPLERYISEYHNSHKIIRIKVFLDEANNVEDVEHIIMYDKISS